MRTHNEFEEVKEVTKEKPLGEKTNESMGGRYGEEPTMNPEVERLSRGDFLRVCEKTKDALNVKEEKSK